MDAALAHYHRATDRRHRRDGDWCAHHDDRGAEPFVARLHLPPEAEARGLDCSSTGGVTVSPRIGAVELGLPDEAALTELVQHQRWFGAKSRSVVRGRLVDSASLRPASPPGTWILFEIEFADGGSELYQLLCAVSGEEGTTGADLTIPPALAQQLIRSM